MAEELRLAKREREREKEKHPNQIASQNLWLTRPFRKETSGTALFMVGFEASPPASPPGQKLKEEGWVL